MIFITALEVYNWVTTRLSMLSRGLYLKKIPNDNITPNPIGKQRTTQIKNPNNYQEMKGKRSDQSLHTTAIALATKVTQN